MNFRHYIFLFLLGLALPVFIAQYQSMPGYLDSDYYFAGGVQLAAGKGFTEPYIWNYLDGVKSLPHPSHSYWQPLASIITALGMWLTGKTDYASGRLFFFLIAALVPPFTSALAYTFSKRKDLAITSGILAVFCVYNAPFLAVPDNFGLFMLLGVLYFLSVTKLLQTPQSIPHWAALGVLSALMTLSRSDGLLWLGITFLFAITSRQLPITNLQSPTSHRLYFVSRNLLISFFAFLLIMSPWYIRNYNAYGSFMPPGGSRALWLAEYNETFIYPPEQLSKETFLAQGWGAISKARVWALSNNLQSGFAAHGGIILFPFIIAGMFYYWKDPRVKLAALAWLILFFVMSFLFPFAGARGAFFHAGAALQPMWWALAPLGLESILVSLRKRGIGNDNNRLVFRSMLVMITIILTAYVVHYRLFVLGWSEGQEYYPAIEQAFQAHGITPADVVIVSNAPGYYLQTGRPAIVFPHGGETSIRAVAKQFNAYYLVVEPRNDLNKKYNFKFLGEVHGRHLYKIEP